MIFKGSGVALVTPFNDDLSVNFDKLKELIDFHIKNKTDAIIILGTTGESATLSDEEKYEIIKCAISHANKRIKIIVGTGSNNTNHAIKLSKMAESLNADGLLIVTPYYNKCSQEGLYLHYKAIAESVKTQIILYNVPSRTGVDIDIDTIKKLSKLKNIVGIKEASPSLTKIANIINLNLENFHVYSGNDDLTLPILSLGGSGVISVLANIKPQEVHNMCEFYFNNKTNEAKELFFKNYELTKALFYDVNPIMVKYAMNYLKMNVGPLRLPLCDTLNINKEKINKLL